MKLIILKTICTQVLCLGLRRNNRPFRAVGTGGGQGEACAPPIIFSDLNVRLFKLHICEFSKPHSFSPRKLMTSPIYDSTVPDLLKIKLIASVCFHSVCPKILVFWSLNSRLTPFFWFGGM